MENEQTFCAYYRVSTTKQGHDGLGIEAQKSALKEYNIIKEFTEVESGKNNNRPKLEAAIKFAKETNSILLVARLDRLARNVFFISKLMENNVKFKCADNPHMDNLTIHIFSAMAQSERERIAKNTKNALNEIKNNIKSKGYHTTRAGKKITSLGNPSEDRKSQLAIARSKRTYKRQPLHVQELIKEYHKSLSIPKIQMKLSSLNIILSKKCIWTYTQ